MAWQLKSMQFIERCVYMHGSRASKLFEILYEQQLFAVHWDVLFLFCVHDRFDGVNSHLSQISGLPLKF